MAKTPQQPVSRKRKRTQHDAVAARPLRRSRRVAYREIFRLNDLPPELRNVIYSMVLRSETSLELTGNLSPTAKALSQVSRAVRIESLGVYFSENDFHAYLSRWWDNGYLQVFLRLKSGWLCSESLQRLVFVRSSCELDVTSFSGIMRSASSTLGILLRH